MPSSAIVIVDLVFKVIAKKQLLIPIVQDTIVSFFSDFLMGLEEIRVPMSSASTGHLDLPL